MTQVVLLGSIGEKRCLETIARLTKIGQRLDISTYLKLEFHFASGLVCERSADFHKAFINPKVSGILAVAGGLNSYELLSSIDFGLLLQ